MMSSDIRASVRFLCMVLLILFQQYNIYAEVISDHADSPISSQESIDFEVVSQGLLFFDSFEQNTDPEYSNFIPKLELILLGINHEIFMLNNKLHSHTKVNNLSFKSGYSILINAP
jgi:hypothetical protein